MEEEFDEKLLEIFKKLNQGEPANLVVNEEKVELVKRLCQILKDITIGAKIDLVLFNPFPNMGNISIEGKRVVVKDTRLFVEIARCADNIEVYGKTNGKVQINLCFYGLKKSLKGKK